MPCFIGCFALFAPRVSLVLVWLFGDVLQRAYAGQVLWPVLGFIFMPLTTLAYAWSVFSTGGVHGGYVVLVVVAVLIDLGLIGAGARGKRKQED
jgi:hypothetical protein